MWAPVTPARNTRADPEEEVACFFALNLKDMLMSLNCKWNLSYRVKNSISAFFRGAASRTCGPPALWLGRRSRPRPAERRLSCRLIEGVTSSIDHSYHERSSAARLTWSYLLPGPSSRWIFFTKTHPRIKGKASKIVPRGRGVRGAATALSGPPLPSAFNRAGP